MVTVPPTRDTELGLQACWTSALSHGPDGHPAAPGKLQEMRLSTIVAAMPGASLLGQADPDITAVVYDSRRVTPGALFVAIPGFKTDGHDYIPQALASGAAAVVIEQGRAGAWSEAVAQAGVPAVAVAAPRAALAQAAAAFYGSPGRRLNVVGVTGTDGKTSLAYLLAHVFGAAGQPAGLISTAECLIGQRPLMDTGRFTTPEAPELQAMLAEMAAAGCRWAVVEATSHGLALHRVDGCEYDIAAVTNVDADHLDFHGSAEEYLAAKGRLFRLLDESVPKGIPKTAVLNADDASCRYFRGLTQAYALTYGLKDGDVRAAQVEPSGWSSRFRLLTPAGECQAVMPKPGLFNVYNALAAAAVGLAAGLELGGICDALASWPGAPGRLERIDEGQPFTVVVDFAHAPASLRRVLSLLRTMGHRRLIAVFGCIGERDKARRAAMGQVAAEMADFTVVTDDNPYTEDRDAIVAEIASGLRAGGRSEGRDFAVVPDRREAIALALGMAQAGDAVLLAGKGHEREVHLRDGSYECDDRALAREILRRSWRPA